MMYFWEIEKSTETDLSRSLWIDPGTLSPVLKKLEQKGYLIRTKDENDERKKILQLSKKGEGLKDKALEIPMKIGSCVGLEKDEAILLGGLIAKILTNIERK